MGKPWKKLSDNTLEKNARAADLAAAFFAAEHTENIPTLDVHGCDLQSAWHETSLFLHTHAFAGVRAVKLIHGRGAGILRDGLREHMRMAREVEAFQESGLPQEMMGVTYILLCPY